MDMSDVETDDDNEATRQVHRAPIWRTEQLTEVIRSLNVAMKVDIVYGDPSDRTPKDTHMIQHDTEEEMQGRR